MSLRQAINLKCKDCIYDPKSGLGNWRQQVTLCQITTCALWSVRPMSSSRRGEAESAPEQAEDAIPEVVA